MNLTDAATLARGLIVDHGLVGWRFGFDRAVVRFGRCSFDLREITLSAPLTRRNDEATVREVVLHEISHALAGPNHGHDNHWKAIAASIGAKAERCYDPASIETVPAPYTATCPGCGRVVSRHRIGRGDRHSCRACSGGSFNPSYELVWRRRRPPVSGSVTRPRLW